MNENEESFNVGDEVYISSGWGGQLQKGTITRVTKTQAIIQHERYEERFNRATGHAIGGSQLSGRQIMHPSDRLDQKWHEMKVRAARIALSKAAEKDDAEAIHTAYRKWNRLTKEKPQ